jgi:chorismate synthase
MSYGRSSQKIERTRCRWWAACGRQDHGTPLAILLPNRARTVQGKEGGGLETVPRPGHADFAGVMKYGFDEIPPISERASARSTAMRVAIGAVAKAFLEKLGVETIGHVRSIGTIDARLLRMSPKEIEKGRAVGGPLRRCARQLRGRFSAGAPKVTRWVFGEVITGLFPVSAAVEWDRKLDARLASAMMSIRVKAVDWRRIDDISRSVDAHDAARRSAAA